MYSVLNDTKTHFGPLIFQKLMETILKANKRCSSKSGVALQFTSENKGEHPPNVLLQSDFHRVSMQSDSQNSIAFNSRDSSDSALESCVQRDVSLPPGPLRSYCKLIGSNLILFPSITQRRSWKHLCKTSEIQLSHLATAKNEESTSLEKYLISFYLL